MRIISLFSFVAVVIMARKSRMNSFLECELSFPSSKYREVCLVWSVASPAGISLGTFYAVRTSVSLLSLLSKTNPHHRSYLSSIFLLTQPTSGPVMPIMFPPGLV